MEHYSTVKKAVLYEKLRGGKARCLVCERKCVLREGEKGFCKTRVNIGGDIYTLVYGDLSALESRPIEIKPFFHFWPGSTAITFSTWSCNFTCPWCQNWTLSRAEPNPSRASCIPPEKVVEKALKWGDEGTCVSFNEPILLFEYSLDVFKLARTRGLYNTYVSNGYITLQALKMLIKAGLDGLKIDVKGDAEAYRKYNSADVNVVWRNAREAKRMGVHVEIVYLVVTKATDSENMIIETIERHLKELGPDTPIHFTRYYPEYMYHEPPTKIEKLEWAYKQAKRMGVNYPYIGNVPGHPYENTYCPECGELLIRRYGAKVIEYNLKDKKCPKCGTSIPVTGKYIKKTKGLSWWI
ncbi:MAG: AmmeMemoRadiSam system radical SAM enzyme [Thermoprotei archaeon]|nr:MAG: AmmeMemoRadiSam system radical SAM enzyme [Thermoprotei archaeon]RLE99174.1 MAG: AmmeMemoRadiSam system radical SAM enzyme [Thermoprotei archaeon]HDI74637.1 AmmeMemoRadiSam system radical SAM enzyme [Thermoprotei archaeon]